MWQINVAGTARVMEAISVVNRTGGNVRQFIFPAASRPTVRRPRAGEGRRPAARAHLPYAIHKRESDEVVRYRAESLGDCRIYILRPHIFTGASVQNYMVGALRGTPAGKSKRAARMRDRRQAPAADAAARPQVSGEALSVSARRRHGAAAGLPALPARQRSADDHHERRRPRRFADDPALRRDCARHDQARSRRKPRFTRCCG